MGQALYRKYRSKSLDEVIGQEHITTTLKNALKTKKISHAYLLTGPRGTGKTSVARILALAVNGLPYDDKPHLDIIEIDAASNRRIDEIRDLRDKVHILPSSAQYKVYIVDEVHMLTREAFNALLKTLEEPPSHVIFILATTEVHKLPETIISRTQHFAFNPIDEKIIASHLSKIAKQENITIDADALSLIAKHGGGSFRDSISLLDQVRNVGKAITETDVRHLLGIAPTEKLLEVLETLQSGTPKDLLTSLVQLNQGGVTAPGIAKQLGAIVRQHIIEGTEKRTTFLRALLEVSASQFADRLIEIVLLDELFRLQPDITSTRKIDGSVSKTNTTHTKETPERIAHAAVEPIVTEIKKAITPKTEVAPGREAAVPGSNSPTEGTFTLNDWPVVLATIKKKYNTLYGILRMSEPDLEASTLTLHFKFAFHEKQLKDTTKRAIVTSTIKDMFGSEVTINCVLNAKIASTKAEQLPTTNEPLDTVSNIFGSAEVLES